MLNLFQGLRVFFIIFGDILFEIFSIVSKNTVSVVSVDPCSNSISPSKLCPHFCRSIGRSHFLTLDNLIYWEFNHSGDHFLVVPWLSASSLKFSVLFS